MKRNRYLEQKKAKRRNFSEPEMWGLYHTISAWIAPHLEEFLKFYAPLATPGNLADEYGDERGNLEWRRILRKMKYSFECLSAYTGYRPEDDQAKIQEGLELFVKYFRYLWY